MADVFSQLYVHMVFSPRSRLALIQPEWESLLFRYITGIVQRRGHKMLAINGMPNHIHIFIGLRPNEAISDLVRETKKASTEFVNRSNLSPCRFGWQRGYGVFSHSHDRISRVCRYIERQKEHHRHKTFRQEFEQLIEENEILIGRKNTFEWYDE